MAANWHYAKGGEKHGPITSAQLKELAATGQLSPDDLVWREDMKEWRKASTVKGLFPEQASTASPPPPPPPSSSPDKTDEVPLWERPAILALLVVCCFPVGLFLVWKNARMTTKEKSLWTAACGGVIVLLFLFNTFMTQGVEKDLARANTLWDEGKETEAVALYQAVLNNRDMYIPDDQKPLVYGRLIDHLAESGNEKEIERLVAKVNRSHPPFEPLVETERGRAVLAKYAATKNSVGDENEEWEAMDLMAKHVIDDLKAKGYPDTNVERFNALMREAANSLGPEKLPNSQKWNQVKPTDFEEFQSEDGLQGKIVYYGPFVKINFVKSRRTGDWNFIVAYINAKEYGGPKYLGF